MSDNLYCVIENQFEIIIEPQTLETATSVLYSLRELIEVYNNGEEFIDYRSSNNTTLISDYRYNPNCLIYLDNLISHVRYGLSNPNTKEVYVELSDRAVQVLVNGWQTIFKENGFMCRPSTGTFVRFKTKPKKVEVKKSVLLRLKSVCVEHLRMSLNNEYDLDMEWRGVGQEKNLRNYVKFGMKLGHTVDSIINDLPFHHDWIQDGKDENGRYIGHREYHSLNYFLTNNVFKDEKNQQELIELHTNEFRKWLEEITLL